MGGLQALNLGSKTIMERLAEIERRIATIERIIGVASSFPGHSVDLGPKANQGALAAEGAKAKAIDPRWGSPEVNRFDG